MPLTPEPQLFKDKRWPMTQLFHPKFQCMCALKSNALAVIKRIMCYRCIHTHTHTHTYIYISYIWTSHIYHIYGLPIYMVAQGTVHGVARVGHNLTTKPYIYTCICMYVMCCVYSLSCVQLFVTPWTVACQAPLSMGFSRQEYQSR